MNDAPSRCRRILNVDESCGNAADMELTPRVGLPVFAPREWKA